MCARVCDSWPSCQFCKTEELELGISGLGQAAGTSGVCLVCFWAGRATAGPAKPHFDAHSQTLRLLRTSRANSTALSARFAPLSTQDVMNYSLLQSAPKISADGAGTGQNGPV